MMKRKSRKAVMLTVKMMMVLIAVIILPVLFSFAPVNRLNGMAKPPVITFFAPAEKDLYAALSLDSLGLSKKAFEEGIAGYRNLRLSGAIQNAGILSIIDFSLPSFKRRLFVLDIEHGKLLFNTLVAHGRNSGQLLATRFSNRNRSYESSLGFYLTGETYFGKKGYALRLLGLEKGINSNAYNRGIVVHAANYVNEDISRIYGRLGRSEGCPAIPAAVHRPVIETIKNGSCFFIYGINKKYASQSSLLRNSLPSITSTKDFHRPDSVRG